MWAWLAGDLVLPVHPRLARTRGPGQPAAWPDRACD